MNKTNIEWVKNPDGTQGFTWNPITGCLNHTNGLCKGGGFPCYAYKLANGRLRSRYLANTNTVASMVVDDSPINMMQKQVKAELDPFYPRFWMNRIEEFDKASEHEWGRGRIVKHRQYPKGIFVCDMGELFGDWIPESWQNWVFETIKRHPEHRFYLLTKQPQNLARWSPFPNHCWVGSTCTSKRAINRTLPSLMKIVAGKVFLSIEPFLQWDDGSATITGDRLLDAGVDWVIIGAQTKPYKPPKIEWVSEIIEAVDKAGIPVFVKDNLKPLLRPYYEATVMLGAIKNQASSIFFKKYDQLHKEDFKLRQELPK